MAFGRVVIILIQIALCAARWSPPPEKICVDDCFNRTVGFYQSCQGCGLFTVCIWDNLFTMKCVDDKVWDDALESCQTTSKTCPESNMRYGSHFRYTKGSSSRSSFLTMFFKMMSRTIPRLKYTFGHQNDERRDNPAGGQMRTRMLDDTSSSNIVRPCVKRCSKKHSGPYPLCGSCKRYVVCSDGFPYIETCKGGKEWDDRLRTCVPRSGTCGGEDEDISVVLTRAIQNVAAMKQLYVVSYRIPKRQIRILQRNSRKQQIQFDFSFKHLTSLVDYTLRKATSVLMVYFVMIDNARQKEQQQRGKAWGPSFEKQVKDLMIALRQVSDSLQRIMTSRGLEDGRDSFERLYQNLLRGLPARRPVGYQKPYMMLHSLEKFLAGARAYFSSLM